MVPRLFNEHRLSFGMKMPLNNRKAGSSETFRLLYFMLEISVCVWLKCLTRLVIVPTKASLYQGKILMLYI